MSTAVLILLPVYDAQSMTSLQDSVHPRWRPEVNGTKPPRPIDIVVERLQTSARPELTISPRSSNAERPASIPPFTDHRPLHVDESESPDESRDEMTSPEVARADDRTLVEKTLQRQLKPSHSPGNYRRCKETF